MNAGLALTAPSSLPSGGVAHYLDTEVEYTAGLLMSFRNNGVEKASIDYAGVITGSAIAGAAFNPTGDINLQAGAEIVWAGDTTLRRDSAGVLGTPDDLTVLGTLTVTTADINGGTMDGVVIGDASAANATVANLFISGNVTLLGGSIFATDTSDGSDNAAISWSAGGAVSNSRGATFNLYGNEHGTNPGQVKFQAGNVAGATVEIKTPASAGVVAIISKNTSAVDYDGANATHYGYIQGTTTNGFLRLRGDSGAANYVEISNTGLLTAQSVDINGGTLDGVTIGGASAAAATVTTLKTGIGWNDSTLASNAISSSNATDGFAFGVSSLLSTWFSWDSTNGAARAIDVWNDGSLIALGIGGANIEFYGYLQGATANGYLDLRGDSGASNGMRLTNVGLLALGDTANANMTVGLTINQGANDDEILALKSSDMAHGLIGQAETDTYAFWRKHDADLGGISHLIFAEDGATPTVYQMVTFGGTATTNKTTAARALAEIVSYEHDGANGLANITADGNVFAVRARVGGSLVARMMVDEDGDLYSATAAQTFDDYDDLALVETLDVVRGKDVVRNEFAKFATYNEQTLIDIGVLGAPVADGGMTNVTQLQRVHNGAIRQLGSKQYEMAELLSLLAAESNNPALQERAQALLPKA